MIITAERLLVLCVERRLEALDNNDDDVRSELNETRRHVDALSQNVNVLLSNLYHLLLFPMYETMHNCR